MDCANDALSNLESELFGDYTEEQNIQRLTEASNHIINVIQKVVPQTKEVSNSLSGYEKIIIEAFRKVPQSKIGLNLPK